MTVKVLEFKIFPDKEFQIKFNDWSYGLKKFWNYCLKQFEILDENTYYDKISKTRVPCCKLPWDWTYDGDEGNKSWVPCSHLIAPDSIPIIRNASEARQYHLKKGQTAKDILEEKGWQNIVVTTPIAPSMPKDKNGNPYTWNRGWLGGVGYTKKLPTEYKPAMIENFPKPTSKDANILNKTENIQNSNLPPQIKEAVLAVPYKYRVGTLGQLCISWQEYVKSRSGQNDLGRGKPKYKRYRDRIETIIHPNPNAGPSKPATKDGCRLDGNNMLILPSFGKIKVKGLDKRFINPDGSVPRVKVLKILKRPGGWFIQLTADLERSFKEFKNPLGAIGIDTGLKAENWISTDRFSVSKPRWYRESEQKISKFQRKLNAKKLHRVILWLNHPDNSIDRVKQLFPGIAKDSLLAAMNCKTSRQLDTLVSQNKLSVSALQQLKHFNIFNWRKQDQSCYLFEKLLSESKCEGQLSLKIKKLHEKLKRRRRSHNQKHSTWLVRKFEIIRIEDGLQKATGKSKTKISEDNQSFEKNAQNSRAGMNKSILDAALGGFMQLTEDKSKAYNRDFKRLKPGKDNAYSQDCPVCKHRNVRQKNIKKAEDYLCENCGFAHRDRDVIPGINMVLDEYAQETINWEQLSKEARQAWRLREKWKSARQVGFENEVGSRNPSSTRKKRNRRKKS